ncbi:glycosyltransferase [Paenibacillus sp. PK3_47]|uniref:GAP1-N2 domain-containing protein n=1 Tax=Paenibacillus sp. PK3_47 TaxID=2072642 RepID=UPI00201D5BA0|nr:glycosyltransferase [Paenibacillus sp. PK3_47]UQZ34995.1 glycosyltransferase [Paenibacillus sp. PK3_47]
MNRFTGSVITQQMYTRERRGVYRATEGFDTVAKSESLDNNFVKKILHPFCLYDAPAELAARGEKNEELYPAALHLFHTEANDTVIGQSRYLAADFTGQRSAFFAHNFVVPPIRSEEIVEDYGKWLHADFAGSYDGEPGGTLPELGDIPVRRGEGRADPLSVLKSLGFGEETFKAVLQAVMTSVAGKKKIYVALDVPVMELSQRAVELTEVIYSVLPYDFRRRLGVITYANEPKSRKYIHLTFVEKGSLRQGDRSIERDFTFDMASGRILNADFGGQSQPFAELAWKTLERKGSLEDFARFADSLLPGESTERKLSLALYNELAVFYEIEQGDENLYTGNKQAVLSGLLSYLKPEGALVSRVRLNDMFLERFDREYDLIRSKGIPQPEIMESFKEYFVLKGHNYRVKIVEYFINGMLNCSSAGREDALASAYNIIESDDELSSAFFKRVLAQPVFRSKLLEPYLETRLASAARTSDILRFVTHWGRFLPEALQLSFVRDAVKDYLLEKLQRDKDPVGAVAAIDEAVDKAEKERRRGGGTHPEALALLQELKVAAERFLLNRVSLDELTQEQLLDISFLQYRDITDWQPPLDSISRQKANALRAAYRWFGEENPDEKIFAGLTPKELDDVQLLGRRWLKETLYIEPFERLPLAFYHSADREGGPLDYEALMDLVVRKAGNSKETVYRFFAWSQDSRLFTVSNKKLHPAYRKAVLKYFLNKDRDAFKSREFRKNYMSSAGPALQNVYNEARSKLASPLARWISRSRFQLLISGSILGIVLIGIIVAVSLLRPDSKEAALPAASPSPSAAAAFAPAAVYLGSEGAEGTGSRLVFSFADAEECTAFNPAVISVTASGGDAVAYDVTAIERGGCPVQSPEAGAAGDDGGGNAAAADAAGEESGAAENAPAEGEGGAAEDAPAEGDSGAAENAAAEGDGGAGENAAAEGDGGAAENAPAANTGTAPYTVNALLEAGASVAVGDMITAGKYSLMLEASPGSTPPSATPSAADTDADTGSPEPSAEASADAEAE